MIFSRPTNAPPQMKRMPLVLTRMYSCCGCLRPPWGGTLQTVPSRIFSSACWTPSPETSRVRETFSVLSDLVDFVDVNDAPLCPLHVKVRVLKEAQDDVLDVLADVARFGEGGGIGDGKGHIQAAGQRAGQQGLARAGVATAPGVLRALAAGSGASAFSGTLLHSSTQLSQM